MFRNHMAAACVMALSFVSHISMAQDVRKLSKSEVEEVFTDVTFDGVFLPKNKTFTAYDAPDGKLEILRPNGKRDQGRTWSVNDDGQRCATSPKWPKPRCFDVYEAGVGVYHQYLDGQHVHTLTNFRKGNQL